MKSILILLLIFIVSCKSEPSKDMVKFRLWAKQMDSLQKVLMNRIDKSIKSLDSLAKQIKKENDSIRVTISKRKVLLFDTTTYTFPKTRKWLIPFDKPAIKDSFEYRYSTPI